MMASYKILQCLILLSSTHFFWLVDSFEYEVGDDKGWAVPSSKGDNDFYDQWASKQRFQVDDTVHFKYKEDSVLVVSDEEYGTCHSSHPIFFSNNGDTIFTLDRPGLFYFISGISGHCERGQKMIIKVLAPPKTPPTLPAGNQNGTSSGPSGHNGAVKLMVVHHSITALLVMSAAIVAFLVGFF